LLLQLQRLGVGVQPLLLLLLLAVVVLLTIMISTTPWCGKRGVIGRQGVVRVRLVLTAPSRIAWILRQAQQQRRQRCCQQEAGVAVVPLMLPAFLHLSGHAAR
jgi:hypothetical protein